MLRNGTSDELVRLLSVIREWRLGKRGLPSRSLTSPYSWPSYFLGHLAPVTLGRWNESWHQFLKDFQESHLNQ